MNYENFLELVNNRQACRGFSDKKIQDEILKKIASIARLAPSACNSQPWKMYFVKEPMKVKQVAQCLQAEGRNAFTSTAQAIVVISEIIPENLKPDVLKKYSKDHFVKYDIGELLAYVTLSAKSLGVDSCIIGWMNEEKIKEVLGVGKEEKIGLAVVLGYSDSKTREKTRKSFDKVIKFI